MYTSQRQDTSPAEVDDASSLEYLDTDILLEWVKDKHEKYTPYSYIGDSLIAVNPCQPLDIYDERYHELYTNLRIRSSQPPHVFWVADHAYRSLLETKENQCVVVSGDSGAGKTESTKFILNHLVWLVRTQSDLVDRLAKVNPLLELFGNAATVLNTNSSRFGKLVELEYDSEGSLCAAKIECFILEKFRVTSRSRFEKNFHVLYALFAGMPPHRLEDFNLGDDATFYRILRPSDGSHDVFNSSKEFADYGNMFNDLEKMLQNVVFTSDEIDHLYKILSAVLLISNLDFDLNEDETQAVLADEISEDALEKALEVLEMESFDDLENALVSVKSHIGGEMMIRNKTVRQARDGRDALARELYSSLFYGIIDKVNAKLESSVKSHIKNTYKRDSKHPCIRLLDISGFENVPYNGFEQLLINAANEKLHQYFLQHTFLREREEYEEEKVALTNVNFKDNAEILALIFQKPYGVFPLVDEELSVPKSSDATFLQKCNTYNKKNENYIEVPTNSGDRGLQFGIRHYAGEVIYNAEGFLEKNSDTLPNNLKDVIETSPNIFVRDYFLLGSRTTLSGQRGGRGSLRAKGSISRSRGVEMPFRGERSTGKLTGRVTEHFQNSLGHMMTKLQTGKPIFVRCIKPNISLKAEKFECKLVKHQLQSSGLLEVATVRRCGFPIRIKYEDFSRRYRTIIEDLDICGDHKDRSRAIIDEARITDHQFGVSKVFLKMYHRDQLETVVAQKIAERKAAEKARKEAVEKARQEAAEQAKKETEKRENGSDGYSLSGISEPTIVPGCTLSDSGLGTRPNSYYELNKIVEDAADEKNDDKNEDKDEVDEDDEKKKSSSTINLSDQPAFNAFRLTERDFENGNEFEMKARRMTRFCMYIFLFVVVVTAGALSRISLIWLSKAVVQQPGSHTTALVLLCQTLPVIITWLTSLVKSMFGRKDWPTSKALLGICFVDALQTLARSLFLYKIVPFVDPLEGIILGMGVCQGPALIKFITYLFTKKKFDSEQFRNKRRKDRLKFIAGAGFLLLAFLIQFGSLPVLLLRETIFTSSHNKNVRANRPEVWTIPLFAFLVTVGWWDNFAYGTTKIGPIELRLGRWRRNIGRVRETSFIYSGVIQIVLATVFAHVFVGNKVNIPSVFDNYGHSLKMMFSSTTAFEAHFKTYGLLYIQVGATCICTYCAGIACRLYMQRFAFALPVVLIPLVAGVLSRVCVPVDYLLFYKIPGNCASVFSRTDFSSIMLVGTGVALWISVLILTNYIWNPACERMAKLDRLFVFNHRDPVFPDLALGLRRRQDEKENFENRKNRRNDKDKEPEERPFVHICATMWHETRQEMVQLLKSLFRLDFDICARKLAEKKFGSIFKDMYEADIHIIFDDAFVTDDVTKQRVVNSWVEMLLEELPEAVTSVAKGRIKLEPPDKIVTPYGGRLTWTMPGGTMMHAHLKDKDKIRHRKRWSQIMYLYYLLGFKMLKDFETVEDLINNKARGTNSEQSKVKSRKKSKQPVRPFTSLLNCLPTEVIRKAENVFIMTLDGDVDFRPESVRLLIDRMKKNKKVAAVCGRIHPIGDGPMVWYQQFEYAVGHWLQKAAEHVFGCVMCCPGCFSLFRGSALMDDNVMRMYATEPTEARHYVQYEQGEDRWLCTLLLQQGYKIDYCAGSDAFTYAPETFNDFYIQRRRWSPSTMANIMDLLGSWRTTAKINDNISLFFLFYQCFLMTSSIVAPGLVVYMIAGSYNAVLGIGMLEAYLLSALPVLAYILLCLKAKTEIQVAVAAVMSAVYAIIMMIVTVGTLINIVNDDFTTPNVLFLVGLASVFVITGLCHPKEILCLFPGLLYYLTVPSTFVFLTVFFLCNLNVVSWGTREGPKKVTDELEPAQQQQMKKGRLGKFLDSIGISTFMDDLRAFVREMLGNRNVSGTPAQGLTPRFTPVVSHGSVTPLSKTQILKPKRPEPERKVVLDPSHWAKALESGDDTAKYLDSTENEFWSFIIAEYLKPLKVKKEAQEKIKADLLAARNNIVFAYFLLNLMFTLVILQLQLKADLLKETFYIAGKYEPVSVIFLAAFALLIVIQFLGMLVHQWGTLLHLVASTNVNWFRSNDEEQAAIDAIKETRKLQSLEPIPDDLLPDYDDGDDDHNDDESLAPSYPTSDVSSISDYNPDYLSEDEPEPQHMSHYEKRFHQRFRTTRRQFNHMKPRHQVATVSRSRANIETERRYNLYMRTLRRIPEHYIDEECPPDYV